MKHAYVEALIRLGHHCWSSIYDKSGDWAISTQDDVSRSDINDALDMLKLDRIVEVVRGGELTTTVAEALARDCVAWSEAEG